jgi:hypothetical protein
MATHIVAGRDADARARAGPAFEQAFELEAEDRFRYRQETDAEIRRQLSPGECLTELQVPLEDALPDNRVRLGRQRGCFRRGSHKWRSISATGISVGHNLQPLLS